MSAITHLRQQYQQKVCHEAIYMKKANIPSMADVGSLLSVQLSQGLLSRLGFEISPIEIKGQTAGKMFEEATRLFLEQSFALLQHLRPGAWYFSVQGDIANFVQYKHLASLSALIQEDRGLRTALGDYVVKPDVIVARWPVTDDMINQQQVIVKAEEAPHFSPFRAVNQRHVQPLLHASISCKFTLRSDRSQNARTEGLNLIRNRKGHTPHIVIVTAEPMPTRLASLALGTGDIDCVYHFALLELVAAAQATQNEAAIESLAIMIEGDRLRDISDLPFDLLV
ncbi:MAG: restriction endonuclease [Anaerolineae bacterium]|nr:restriction endonuclease [Anaerolineae bacterium]